MAKLLKTPLVVASNAPTRETKIPVLEIKNTGKGKETEQESDEKKKQNQQKTQKTEKSLDPKTQTHLHQNQTEQNQALYFPFPSSSSDYARFSDRPPRAMRTSAAAAEIVEVQGGGHIVRATGRKDRHSKVCTAKGLRDRRVRLSAHTAIQFYDVQDRLGYDRPSKAVDWLIQNAKPAIDRLAQLPPWRPQNPSPNLPEKSLLSSETGDYASAFGFPPSLDSDSIADTIKSFFPMTAAAASASSSYHAAFGAEDLSLSLQSFQDPIFNQQQSRSAPAHQALFACPAPQGFEAGSWNVSQNQIFTQWGTLQSSNNPPIRAMGDPIALSSANPAFRSVSGEVIGFSGYHIPARIQGGEEEQGSGAADAPHPPSASSASHH